LFITSAIISAISHAKFPSLIIGAALNHNNVKAPSAPAKAPLNCATQ